MRTLFTGVRARATLAAALTLGTIGGTVATATTAHAATATKVTAKPTTTYTTLKAAVSVKGTASPTTTARTVTLQKYTKGKWVKVTATTTKKGAYALKVPTTAVATTTYRVYVSKKGSYAAKASGSFKITVARKSAATLALSPAKVAYGKTAYAKGTISPVKSGRTVYIQRYDYDKKTWISVASGKTNTKGAYSIAVKANHPRGWSLNLRAYTPKITGYTYATSKTVMLKSLTGKGNWTDPNGCLWHTWDGVTMPDSGAPARCWVGMRF